MGLIWTIIIGLIIGVVAKFVHPGRDNLGMIMTIILGIAGAFVAGFIASVLGAVLLLWIYGRVAGGKTA